MGGIIPVGLLAGLIRSTSRGAHRMLAAVREWQSHLLAAPSYLHAPCSSNEPFPFAIASFHKHCARPAPPLNASAFCFHVEPLSPSSIQSGPRQKEQLLSSSNPPSAFNATRYNPSLASTSRPLKGIRHYARRRQAAAAFKPSDYLPSHDEPEAKRPSRAQTPPLPIFPGPERTPELQQKARLFEQAMLAFQERGYLVHPESPQRAEQLAKLDKVFDVFGKHEFPVARLQAALKWEVRHMETSRQRTPSKEELGSVEEELDSLEEDPEESRPVFRTREERKAQREAALKSSRPAAGEQQSGAEGEEADASGASSVEDEAAPVDLHPTDSVKVGSSEGTGEMQEWAIDSQQLEHINLSASSSTSKEPDEEGGKASWKRTERGKRKQVEGSEDTDETASEGPYAGSLKGIVKNVGEGGPFIEYVRGPTQPLHRGGQGPGLTLRQKRLAAQIQRALAEIIVDDAALRQSLLEEHGFAVLEIRMTPELDTAFIRWGCNSGSEKEVSKVLGKSAGRLRTALFKMLGMPFSPRLEFKFDTLSDQIHAIEDAFDRLHDL